MGYLKNQLYYYSKKLQELHHELVSVVGTNAANELTRMRMLERMDGVAFVYALLGRPGVHLNYRVFEEERYPSLKVAKKISC